MNLRARSSGQIREGAHMDPQYLLLIYMLLIGCPLKAQTRLYLKRKRRLLHGVSPSAEILLTSVILVSSDFGRIFVTQVHRAPVEGHTPKNIWAAITGLDWFRKRHKDGWVRMVVGRGSRGARDAGWVWLKPNAQNSENQQNTKKKSTIKFATGKEKSYHFSIST